MPFSLLHLRNVGAHSAGTDNLHSLYWLRYLSIAGQSAAIGIAAWPLDMAIPLPQALIPIAGLLLFNLFVALQLRGGSEPGINEYLLHLAVDLIALAAVLYFTGGATNPFVFLFLLPLTIAATVLPAQQVWALAALAVLLYSALLRWHVPLPHGHSAGHDFSLHIAGMWFGFVLAAGIVSYFIAGMRQALRRRDAELAEVREQALRDERLVALGTLAAATAHELGTPLFTASLLAAEIEQELTHSGSAKAQQLREQLNRCKQALRTLSVSAGDGAVCGGHGAAVDVYLDSLLQSFHARRPQIQIRTDWQGARPAPLILAERSLDLALTNILDNAADVSPSAIDWQARWNADALEMSVLDRGPGLSDKARDLAGRTPYSDKPQGLGLGLFLAHGIIERLGGVVRLLERSGGGLETRVHLPLTSLAE